MFVEDEGGGRACWGGRGEGGWVEGSDDCHGSSLADRCAHRSMTPFSSHNSPSRLYSSIMLQLGVWISICTQLYVRMYESTHPSHHHHHHTSHTPSPPLPHLPVEPARCLTELNHRHLSVTCRQESLSIIPSLEYSSVLMAIDWPPALHLQSLGLKRGVDVCHNDPDCGASDTYFGVYSGCEACQSVIAIESGWKARHLSTYLSEKRKKKVVRHREICHIPRAQGGNHKHPFNHAQSKPFATCARPAASCFQPVNLGSNLLLIDLSGSDWEQISREWGPWRVFFFFFWWQDGGKKH